MSEATIATSPEPALATAALRYHEAFTGELARWSVRGPHGVVCLTAMAPLTQQRNPVRDARGVAWQPEAVSVHRTLAEWSGEPTQPCDFLARCYAGPVFTSFAWQFMRQWERHGHPDGMLRRHLTNVYRGVFGGVS